MKKIKIFEEFKSDYITREAGERLRNLIIEEVQKGEKICLNFENRLIASTSFFDEGLAKLAEHGWTRDIFNKSVVLEDLHKKDRLVLDAVRKDRGL